MKFVIFFVFIVSSCLLNPCESNAGVKDITTVDELRIRLLDFVSKLWSKVTDQVWNEIVNSSGADLEIAKSFVDFDKLIKQEANGSAYQEIQGLDNSWIWMKVSSDLSVVTSIYDTFLKFCETQINPLNVPAPVHDWLDMAETIITDPNTSVMKAVNRIDQMILHAGLYGTVLEDANPDLCNLQQSPHQLLYNMYNRISLTEIKGFAMLQFSWMLLKLYGKGNFTQEANLMTQRYEERTSLMVTGIKAAMKKARRDLYKCDPPIHEEGETFVQITRLLQGYIENEVDMNPDGTCKENCAAYINTKNYGCFKDQYCARQAQCTGRILNCQYIDSDMWICPATQRSGRRYEWIEYENGRMLGKPGSCMRGTSKVDSWWRYLVYHCSYCLCLCEEAPEYSERFFSLREVVADTNQNKVITGVRFMKANRVIHLQINEGTLEPRANIDQSSLKWQPIDPFDPEDDAYVNGVDYHMLTDEQRAIDLDELEGHDGHVLTGLRFIMIGAHLRFEIRVTPFNYTTGNLKVEQSRWIGNDNTEGSETPRKPLKLDKPDIPTRQIGIRYPVDSTHDQYIEFTHTDFDADAAQTTVPFIDAQIVLPTFSVPLTGAGLYHRGQRGSGGFIAPKVYTYDYSSHLFANKPNDEYTIQDKVEIVPKA